MACKSIKVCGLELVTITLYFDDYVTRPWNRFIRLISRPYEPGSGDETKAL